MDGRKCRFTERCRQNVGVQRVDACMPLVNSAVGWGNNESEALVGLAMFRFDVPGEGRSEDEQSRWCLGERPCHRATSWGDLLDLRQNHPRC